MNLREELEKNKNEDEGNKNDNQLKKVFIEYLKGNEISQVDENKILDELQNCIDKKSYDSSALKDELEYCDNKWYSDNFIWWKKVKLIDRNYKKMFIELDSITSLPKAVQLALEEIVIDRSFVEYNKFLEENNIKQLNDNYSIEELEDTIVSIIEKNNEGKQKKEWEWLDSISIKTCNIATLFYVKDKEHFVLENQRMKFKNRYWSMAIYIKSLLRGKTIISNSEAFGNTLSMHASGSMNGLMTYNFKKYDIDKNHFFIYENLSEDEVKNQINLIDAESTKRNNIAKLFLEPIVNKILNGFKNLEINMKRSEIEYFSLKKERLEQLLNNDLKNDIQNKKIFQFYGKWNFYDLLIIDNCFFAIIKDLCPSDELMQLHPNYNNVIFGSFSDKDIIDVRDNEDEVEGKIDVSVPYLGSKKASVIGRTIVGQALGGTTGGIVGAYSAIEANNKREEIIRNQKPIIHNYKYKIESKQIKITLFYNYEDYSCETRKVKKENDIRLKLDKSVFNQEEIENTIKEIKLTQSKEVLDNSKIILNFFDENGLEKFDEEDLRKYIRKVRKDNYWKEHPEQKEELEKNLEELKIQEKSIQNEITDIDNKNKPEIDKIKSKYSCEFEEENEIKLLLNEITDLNVKSNKMNFLNFIEKNKIKNLVTEKNNQVEQLQVTLKEKKDEVLQKMQSEIDFIEKDKNILKTKLEENLKKQQEIINELERER